MATAVLAASNLFSADCKAERNTGSAPLFNDNAATNRVQSGGRLTDSILAALALASVGE